jgi:hypothetical protein
LGTRTGVIVITISGSRKSSIRAPETRIDICQSGDFVAVYLASLVNAEPRKTTAVP